MKIQFSHKYEDIISIENLLDAWQEFVKNKKSRKDVQEFKFDLMGNILTLHEELKTKQYCHSAYEAFNISDPKPRNIHKAKVRDRLLHHAIYRQLYPFFDRVFIADSFSCRLKKGTLKAINRFRTFARKSSQNHTKTVWVLKCDIRKFFAPIDQKILKEIIASYVPDQDILWLISQVIDSFFSTAKNVGLPLGNLTSQLLVNIYMNEFDQFMKHKLKTKYYIRYADDFVIFSRDKDYLINMIPQIRVFLVERLHLQLHPQKISIKTIASGVDYLGWVNFTDHRVIRTVTKKKMFKKIEEKEGKKETVQSYVGLLSHGNGYKIKKEVDNLGHLYSIDSL